MCPISALLFILVAEIKAIKIRDNEKIKGIKIENVEYKISLMADDTTLFLSDLESLEIAIKEFQLFSQCSGLKLNINKTEIIPLGKLQTDTHQIPESLKEIQIKYGPFMQKLVNIWTSRALSLKGKITIIIIRSLIIPQIQFLFSMVFVPHEMLQQIDNLLFKF